MDIVGCRIIFKQKNTIQANPLVELKVLELTKNNIKIQHLDGTIQWLDLPTFHEEYEIVEILK